MGIFTNITFSNPILQAKSTALHYIMYTNPKVKTIHFAATKSYKWKYPALVGSTITAIIENDESELLALTISNHPDTSGFTIFPLSSSSNNTTDYSIDHLFVDIWPLVEKGDPKFGSITATAPVNTNHIAIGYGKPIFFFFNSEESIIYCIDSGTICVVPLSLALLHLNSVSSFLKDREDVRVFENAHSSAVTCMMTPEHNISNQQYLLSGGQDGVVKIWNLM